MDTECTTNMENVTTPSENMEDRFSLELGIGVVILYCIMGFLVLTINLLTFAIIVYFGEIKENSNVMIASLNLAESLSGLVILGQGLSFALNLSNDSIIYAIGSFLNFLSLCVSQWHVVFLSLDRLIAVQCALTYHILITSRRLKMLIFAAWGIGLLMASALSLPFLQGLNQRNLYLFPAFQILLILVLNAVMYIQIWKVAQQQRRQITAQEQTANPQQRIVCHNRLTSWRMDKATRIIVLIVLIFGILWTPFVVQVFRTVFGDVEYERIAYVYLVGFLNSILNCFVYVYLNKKLRRKIRSKCLGQNQ